MGEEARLATYTVLPDDHKEIVAAAEEVGALLKVLETWSIRSPEDEETAGQMMKKAHEEHKALEKRRKEIVAPALDAQRTINDLFRPATQGWNEVKGIAKRLLNEVVARREQERQAQLAKVAAEAAVGAAPTEKLEAPKAPAAGTAFRDEVHIQIMDVSLVPREYMCVDMSALKILARKGGEAPPGVTFTRQTTVRVK